MRTKLNLFQILAQLQQVGIIQLTLNEKGKVFIWGSDPSTQNKESIGKFFKEITELRGVPKIKKIACGS